MQKKITHEMFLERAYKIHGTTYNYLTEFVDYKTKILIECKLHGSWLQNPNNHLSGKGCKKCGARRTNLRISYQEFILRAYIKHETTYQYHHINPDRFLFQEKQPIECDHHGIFWQLPSSHVNWGHHCEKCSYEKRTVLQIWSKEQFVKKAEEVWKGFYKYPGQYNGTIRLMTMECPDHGIWMQTPSNHLRYGCRRCNTRSSILEPLWLDEVGVPEADRQYIIYRDELTKTGKHRFYIVDGIDHQNKIVYEYYGDYIHGNPYKYPKDKYSTKHKCTFGEVYEKTIKKEKFLKSKGYSLVVMWDSDFRSKIREKEKFQRRGERNYQNDQKIKKIVNKMKFSHE